MVQVGYYVVQIRTCTINAGRFSRDAENPLWEDVSAWQPTCQPSSQNAVDSEKGAAQGQGDEGPDAVCTMSAHLGSLDETHVSKGAR